MCRTPCIGGEPDGVILGILGNCVHVCGGWQPGAREWAGHNSPSHVLIKIIFFQLSGSYYSLWRRQPPHPTTPTTHTLIRTQSLLCSACCFNNTPINVTWEWPAVSTGAINTFPVLGWETGRWACVCVLHQDTSISPQADVIPHPLWCSGYGTQRADLSVTAVLSDDLCGHFGKHQYNEVHALTMS